MDYLIRETWRCQEAEHRLHSLSCATRFFLQFTHSTVHWRFTFFQLPCWNLIQVSTSRVPILPDKHYLWIGARGIADKRQYCRRTRVPDDLQLPGTAVRVSDLIDIERNNLAGIDPMRCDLRVGHEFSGFAFRGLQHRAVRIPALPAVHGSRLRHQQPLSAWNQILYERAQHGVRHPLSPHSFVHDMYRTSLPATHRW